MSSKSNSPAPLPLSRQYPLPLLRRIPSRSNPSCRDRFRRLPKSPSRVRPLHSPHQFLHLRRSPSSLHHHYRNQSQRLLRPLHSTQSRPFVLRHRHFPFHRRRPSPLANSRPISKKRWGKTGSTNWVSSLLSLAFRFSWPINSPRLAIPEKWASAILSASRSSAQGSTSSVAIAIASLRAR